VYYKGIEINKTRRARIIENLLIAFLVIGLTALITAFGPHGPF
jgi:hypothetical protein